MSAEENKALFVRLQDELNRGNVDIVDEVVDPNAVLISPHLPEPVRGRQAFKDAFGGVGIEALALQYTLEQIIAEGDSVAARFVGRGTHRGEFEGAAAEPGSQSRWTSSPFTGWPMGRSSSTD